MSASEDAADIQHWVDALTCEPLSLAQRMALSGLVAFSLKRSLEVAELKGRMEGRVSAPVLRLIPNMEGVK